MATQISASTPITILENIAKGHNRISMTHWDDNLEPEIASGSVFEFGGVTFYCDGDDDIDVAGAWGGIGKDTLVFIYYANTGIAELSTTAPTWDEALCGWYNAGLTKVCIGSIYKDSGGNYTQKTIFLNQEEGITYQGKNLGLGANADRLIRLATDASYGWDETNSYFEFDQPIDNTKLNTYKYTDAVLLKSATDATETFELKKPISAYVKVTTTDATDHDAYLQIYQNGSWRTVSHIFISYTGSDYDYNLQLNPGYYRLDSTDGTSFTIYLYCTGVFGNPTVTASDIVT